MKQACDTAAALCTCAELFECAYNFPYTFFAIPTIETFKHLFHMNCFLIEPYSVCLGSETVGAISDTATYQEC